MNNSMVAHLWANEQKKSAKGNNFYFEGSSIYSYGRHFEAGRIVRNKRGERAYLVNTTYHSKITACKHMPKVWGSIPTGELTFGMEGLSEGEILYVVRQLEAIKSTAEKYKNTKTKISYRDIWKPFKSLMAYIEFFDMGTPKQLLKKNVNEWLGTKHELTWESDRVKQEYVRELKRIFRILLDHQNMEVPGIVNVIIDEICGDGTQADYVAKWKLQDAKEAAAIERRRIENEALKKPLEERTKMWKAGKIMELYVPFSYTSNDEPNVWLRIKNGKIGTSKGIELSKDEAKRLWERVKSFHDGAQFQHDLARDSYGNSWAFNKYQNDVLTVGCHRIAYSEMEEIAMKLGFM